MLPNFEEVLQLNTFFFCSKLIFLWNGVKASFCCCWSGIIFLNQFRFEFSLRWLRLVQLGLIRINTVLVEAISKSIFKTEYHKAQIGEWSLRENFLNIHQFNESQPLTGWWWLLVKIIPSYFSILCNTTEDFTHFCGKMCWSVSIWKQNCNAC